MNGLSQPIDDAVFSTLLRDAYVGSTRVTPHEIDMLLARLEGYTEASAARRDTLGG